MRDEEKAPARTKAELRFKKRGMQWLKDHGGKWVKVKVELEICFFTSISTVSHL